MINLSVKDLIEGAEWRLDEAQYPPGGYKKARIWDVNFLIATIYALIAIAKVLEDIRKEIRIRK